MAWDQWRTTNGQLAFDHVKISAANAASSDLQEYFILRGFGNWNFGQYQRTISNRRRCGQNPCLHRHGLEIYTSDGKRRFGPLFDPEHHLSFHYEVGWFEDSPPQKEIKYRVL